MTTYNQRDADAPMPSARVTVYSGANQQQTEIVRGALMAAGIPATIGEQVTEAYAPNLAVAEGHWGTITVPVEFEEPARAVLAGFEEGQGRVSAEDLEQAAMDSYDPRV